jgi:hypothetical protein
VRARKGRKAKREEEISWEAGKFRRALRLIGANKAVETANNRQHWWQQLRLLMPASWGMWQCCW